MEAFHIHLGNEAVYDQVVHRGIDGKGALGQASEVTLATKDGVTKAGRAGAVLAFDVQCPDGSVRTAQATITVRQLMMALAALRGRYGEDGFAPDVVRN